MCVLKVAQEYRRREQCTALKFIQSDELTRLSVPFIDVPDVTEVAKAPEVAAKVAAAMVIGSSQYETETEKEH